MNNKLEAFDKAVVKLETLLGEVDKFSPVRELYAADKLNAAHRVLDLLVEMDGCCLALWYSWRKKALHIMFYGVSYHTDRSPTFKGGLPEATLAAVTSDEFKEWRQANERVS